MWDFVIMMMDEVKSDCTIKNTRHGQSRGIMEILKILTKDWTCEGELNKTIGHFYESYHTKGDAKCVVDEL